MTPKLYQVTIRTVSTRYKTFFSVAFDPKEAYQQVRDYLDEKDVLFKSERELYTIKLLAECVDAPDCGAILLISDSNNPQ
jgi:hypothetical protein